MGQRSVVGTPLPGAALPYLPLKRPGPGMGGKIEGWALSEAIIGIATHFYDRRTIPCTRHLGLCQGCAEWHRKANWSGYLAVAEHRTFRPVIFQLSRAAVDDCQHLDEESFVLRGSFVIVGRRGESDQGRVWLGFSQDRSPRPLIKPPDVLASLARMWEMDADALRRAVGWKEGAA